ncbi:hypothetical protein F4679DRAFT_86892 [Xylaria curta]|nr:hypothetical protein F4679DRAFT_86892 [Xylaria curta]
MPLGGRSPVADKDGDRKAKRVRVSVACVTCRNKKERCDGAHPVCGSCRKQRRQCCYSQREKKRGLPVGYVRALEILFGLLFHSVDGVEASALSLLRGERKIRNIQPSSLRDSKTSTFADKWRQSDVWKEMERLLLSVEAKDGELSGPRDVHDKLDAVIINALDIRRQQEGEVDIGFPELAASPPQNYPLNSNDASTSDTTDQSFLNDSQALIQLESISTYSSLPQLYPSQGAQLPSDWFRLVEAYYSTTHCWFPVIPKQDILRTAHVLADHTSSHQLLNEDLASLWAVLAYASHQDALSPTLDSTQHETRSDLARKLSMDSMALCTKPNIRPSIQQVWACLVSTLYHLSVDSLSQAWLLIGQAVYMAVDLGIIQTQLPRESKPVDDKRERIGLGCFILDTIVALRLGRRAYLAQDDLNGIGLTNVDGIEEWESWSPVTTHSIPTPPVPARILSLFTKFAGLVGLLNEVVTTPSESFNEQRIVRMTQDLLTLNPSSLCPASSTTPQSSNALVVFAIVHWALENKASSVSEAVARDYRASLRDSLDVASLQLQENHNDHIHALKNTYIHIFDTCVINRSGRNYEGTPERLQWETLLRELSQARGENQTSAHDVIGRDGSSVHKNPPSEPLVNTAPDRGLCLATSATGESDIFGIVGDNNDLYNSLSMLDACDWEGASLGFLENLGIPHSTTPISDQNVLLR